jgi:hypothetical protein
MASLKWDAAAPATDRLAGDFRKIAIPSTNGAGPNMVPETQNPRNQRACKAVYRKAAEAANGRRPSRPAGGFSDFIPITGRFRCIAGGWRGAAQEAKS